MINSVQFATARAHTLHGFETHWGRIIFYGSIYFALVKYAKPKLHQKTVEQNDLNADLCKPRNKWDTANTKPMPKYPAQNLGAL